MILCGERKGWDQERNHPIQGAVLQINVFSDRVDEKDGGKETICSFTGQRKMHCPVKCQSLCSAVQKGRDSVKVEKGGKIDLN